METVRHLYLLQLPHVGIELRPQGLHLLVVPLPHAVQLHLRALDVLLVQLHGDMPTSLEHTLPPSHEHTLITHTSTASPLTRAHPNHSHEHTLSPSHPPPLTRAHPHHSHEHTLSTHTSTPSPPHTSTPSPLTQAHPHHSHEHTLPPPPPPPPLHTHTHTQHFTSAITSSNHSHPPTHHSRTHALARPGIPTKTRFIHQ